MLTTRWQHLQIVFREIYRAHLNYPVDTLRSSEQELFFQGIVLDTFFEDDTHI